MVYVIMGVSGVGKTRIGKAVALRLGLSFYDADDFHPLENVNKMREGLPLTDEDREPWLDQLNKKIKEWNKKEGAVLACSALRSTYREKLAIGSNVLFVMLKADRDVIMRRMKDRKDHYMPVSLLDSQISTLEELEEAYVIDNSSDQKETVENVIELIRRHKSLP